jgi:hypothetical protein
MGRKAAADRPHRLFHYSSCHHVSTFGTSVGRRLEGMELICRHRHSCGLCRGHDCLCCNRVHSRGPGYGCAADYETASHLRWIHRHLSVSPSTTKLSPLAIIIQRFLRSIFRLFGGQFTLVYYVPIYFQAIVGISAQDSGVLNLAYIIPISEF